MVSHWQRQKADDILQKQADTDYADDLMLLTNTPGQAKSQLHKVKQAAERIGFYIQIEQNSYVLNKTKPSPL